MSELLAVCAVCGAQCTQKNKLKRFRERHPAECRNRMQQQLKRAEFNHALAQDVKSVEDDHEDDEEA